MEQILGPKAHHSMLAIVGINERPPTRGDRLVARIYCEPSRKHRFNQIADVAPGLMRS